MESNSFSKSHFETAESTDAMPTLSDRIYSPDFFEFNLPSTSLVSTAQGYLPDLEIVDDAESGSNSTEEPSVPALQYGSLTAPVPFNEIGDVGHSTFALIDTDMDGFLTEDELGNAVSEMKFFHGQRAQIVGALYENVSDIQALSDDEFWSESGISRTDLNELDEIGSTRYAIRSLEGVDVNEWSREVFQYFDGDDNNFLSREEISSTLEDGKTRVADEQILEYCLDNFAAIQSTVVGGQNSLGVSRSDLTTHVQNLDEGDHSRLLDSIGSRLNRTSNSQSLRNSTELFGEFENTLESISSEAIAQGSVGNCFFLASLTAVAENAPHLIPDMIEENGSGSYTVTFPGDPSHPVTVSAPTEAEMGLFQGGSTFGIWPSVLEKAYGQYLQTYKGYDSATPTQAADGGGNSADVLSLLTGQEYRRVAVDSMTEAELTRLLSSMSTSSSVTPMVACIAGDSDGKKTESSDGYPKDHAYGILDYSLYGNDGYIELRNPWGSEFGSVEGTSRISVDQFRENFTAVCVPIE